MKAASGTLQDYLASLSDTPVDWNGWVYDLYTFKLVNGTVLNWCSGDIQIILSQGPITGSTLHAGGTGYAVGDTGKFIGVSFDATYIITSVSGGVVTGYSITSAGTLYQIWTRVASAVFGAQPGVGVGFQINVTSVGASVTFSVMTPANPNYPAIERSKVNSTVGLSVDDLIIKIYSAPGTMVNGTQLLAALVRGDFDGALVLVQRLISLTPGNTSMGTFTVFSGSVGDVNNIGIASAEITVKALTDLLSITMPRNLYQPGCINTLFDAGCTLSESSFRVSGSVGAGASVIVVPSSLSQPGGISAPASAPTLGTHSMSGINLTPQVYYATVTYVDALGETVASPESFLSVGANLLLTVLPPPSASGATGWNVYVGLQPGAEQKQNGTPIAIGTNFTLAASGLAQGQPSPLVATNGYFSQGVITFTSGANSGQSRSVIGYSGAGVLTLLVGLPVAPSNGDTFTIVPGCDKQMSTCIQKYNNVLNFRGTPFVPQPEAVI